MSICEVVSKLVRCLAFTAIFSLGPSAFSGQSVTLAWDPNPEANLAGYKLYYGTASRSYGASIGVDKPLTTGTISNLVEGQTYFFAVTAVTTDMLESDYSEEVSYFVPTAGPNSQPLALDGSAQTSEDQAVDIVLQGTDADRDPLSYAVIVGPAHGTLTGSPPNLTYQPRANHHGNDAFTFRVTDGKSDPTTATFRLTVNPVPDPPIAQDDAISTIEGVPLTFTVNQLLANDFDPDGGEVLSVASVESSSVSGAMLEFAAGIITYTPKLGLSGSDAFTYTIRDLSGLTAAGRVHVNVTAPPDTEGPVVAGWSVAGKDARCVLMKWTTDEPSRCVLDYGNTSSLERQLTVSSDLRVDHSFLLEWLEPNTTYFVRLRSTDSRGNTSFSGIATITTPELVTLSWAAESGTPDGPMYMDLIDTAMNESYILSPTNGWGTVSYPVQVGVYSNYRIWCRLWAPAAGFGSFRVSVDGGAEDTFDTSQIGWKDNWQWVLVNGREGVAPLASNPRLFTLGPGIHQISFQTDEAGTFLDHLILSNDPDWTPAIQEPPPELTATAVSSNHIVLTWTENIATADGFQIQWSPDGVNFQPLIVLPHDAKQYDHTDLPAPAAYHYRIYAYNSWDRTEFSNIAMAHLGVVDRSEQPPDAPPFLDAQAIGRRRVQINWVDGSNNEKGFLLERSTDGYTFTVAQVFGPDISLVEDRPPTRGWFYYRVRAFNSAGNSDPSNTTLVHVKQ